MQRRKLVVKKKEGVRGVQVQFIVTVRKTGGEETSFFGLFSGGGQVVV